MTPRAASTTSIGLRPTTASEKADRAALADREHLANIDAQILDLEILTLPNEIVSELFVHFIPVYPKRPPLTGLLSPVLICQICRRGREIVLSTPVLWRVFTLSLGKTEPLEQQLHLLDAFLKRSGSRPLSIKLNNVALPQFIQAITSRAARWERWH
ncbi:hypothetical protein C8R44DRAFT_872200 [Mycena epipterygia]|nr:hypothetical protein C8R44DRAFT_872200 [Mycena epipterygia]